MPTIVNYITLDKSMEYSMRWLLSYIYYTEQAKNPKLPGAIEFLAQLEIQRNKLRLFSVWIPENKNSALYKMANIFKYNEIPFKCPIPGDSLLPDHKKFPAILCGKRRVEFLPIIYDITKDDHIKTSINYATMVYGGLNEYYYIENNGMYRGEKYKQNLPLDQVPFNFADPFVWKVSEVVNIGVQPVPKPAPVVLIPENTNMPILSTPTIPAATIPAARNKNILIIGGLIAAFLIFKK